MTPPDRDRRRGARDAALTTPTVDAPARTPEQEAPAAPRPNIDPNAATQSFHGEVEPVALDEANAAYKAWQAMNAADAVLSVGAGDSLTNVPLVRRIAQFVLLERLGVGGMGAVFAAFDEKLERKVAIKVVTAQGPLAQERLLREAQAQARLSHPNVVTVYEVGTLPDGRLFLAMELVKGQTLRTWQSEQRRAWREVLDLYLEAGRGLAAAHRGGIVHRDFKPDNILLGEDGRVRVADFGLAFAAENKLADGSEPGHRPSSEAEELLASRPSGAARHLTAAGAVAGTPGYMAPEQLTGAAIDARSDQFAFCVSLFEALYGVRPYADMAFFRDESPELRRPSPDPLHPRWLWDALVRGLSIAPEQRFSSMDALLAELSRKRGRARLWLAGGAAFVMAAAAVAWTAAGREAEPPRCQGAASELAGVWDGAVKQRIGAAVRAAPDAFAAQAWQSTERALDEYAQRWLGGHRAACEATHVRHVQSPELLDLRMECLAARKRSWSAAVEVLSSRPAKALEHADQMLASLGDLSRCADTRALLEQGRQPGVLTAPPTPAEQARRAKVRQTLASAGALLISGEVAAAGEALADARREAGADGAVAAEVRYVEGKVALARSEVAESISLLSGAADLAVAARQDDLAIDVWLTLALDAGLQEQEPAEIAQWLGQGEAWLRRLGRTDDSRSVVAAHARGAQEIVAGKAALALETLTGALASAEGLWGKESTRLVAILRDRARAFARLRRPKDAIADAERALALGLAAWGPTFPDIARTRRALGLLYVEQLGDLDRGQREIELAIAADSARVGPESLEVANGAQMLSQVALYRGDYKTALGHIENAEKIFAKRLGADHPRRGEALAGLGVVRYMVGDYAGSLAAYRAAQPIQVAALGDDHRDVAFLFSNLGETELALGQAAPAVDHFGHALEILERRLGATHDDVALPLKGLGLAQLMIGKPKEALAPLERALALREGSAAASAPQELAEIRWALARALAATGAAKGRARSLAEAALEGYRALGEGSAAQVQQITAWLRGR